MATARKGSTIKAKMNMLLYGTNFSGKSTLAMQAALLKREDGKNFRVLVFDTESGGTTESIDTVVEQGANPDDIYCVYTQSISEIKEYIKRIAENEPIYDIDENGDQLDEIVLDSEGNPFKPDVIIIDSTSVLKLTTQNSLINLSQKRNKIKAEKSGATAEERYVSVMTAGMELKDYQKMATTGQDLVLSLMSLPCSVILTSREKDETISQKDADGRIASIATGKKTFDSFKGIDYNVKTIIRMYKDEDLNEICAYVEKDRTKVHEFGETIISPSLLDYQIIFDKSTGKKEFNVRNNFDKAVETDEKILEKEMFGAAGPSENDNNTSTSDVSVLQAQIKAAIFKMSPVEKKAMQETLKSSNLPTAYNKVTDIDTLNKILAIVSE